MPRPLVGKLHLESLSCLASFSVLMSEYYRKLDAVAQNRYLEKLKLLGLEAKDNLSYCSYTTKGVHVHIKNLVGRNPICMTACYDHVHTILRFIT